MIGRSRALVIVVAAATIVTSFVPSPSFADFPIAHTNTWQANDKVNDVLPVGEKLFIGGAFTALEDHAGDSVPRTNLAAISTVTGLPTPFNPTFNGDVYGLTLSPDEQTLYAVGNFTTVNETNRKRIVAFDVATGEMLAFKAKSPNGSVRTIATIGDVMYIGGTFTKVGGVPRARLAAIDAATGALLSSWQPEADLFVRAMVVESGQLYVGGNFKKINSQDARGIVQLDPQDGSIIPTQHTSYPVLDLALQGNQIFIAGAGPGGRAAAFNRSTGQIEWSVRSDGNIQAVAASGNFAYFGGHHFTMDGEPAHQLSRLDIVTGAVDTSWVPAVNGLKGVLGLASAGPNLFIAGDFTTINNKDQQGFAQFVDDLQPPVADLSISARADQNALPVGDQLTYTVQVDNIGPAAASNVEVVNQLPASMEFASSTDGCTANGSGQVRCPVGLVLVGGSATHAFTVHATAPGIVDNTLVVESDATDPNPSNDSANVQTEIHTVPGTADISVTQSSNQAEVSTSFAIDVVVSNDGPDSAYNVLIANFVSPEATILGASPTAGNCVLSLDVECDLGTIAAGSTVTVTISMIAPATPMTMTNFAVAQTSSADPDPTDDQSAGLTTVYAANPGDTTPPSLVGLAMLDVNSNGHVDTVLADFDETLAICSSPCEAGWVMSNVPSQGTLTSVQTSGSRATLSIAEGPGDPTTAVDTMTVALAGENSIQDAAGNHASFAATVPADFAGPVPVTVRKANAGVNGLAEAGDKLTVEWSETISGASVPATIDLIIDDPAGPGNDTLTAVGMMAGPLDSGSDGFLAADGTQARFNGSAFALIGTFDTTTLTLSTCSGDCSSLLLGPATTILYVPAPTITDPAGNAATGSFLKSFRLF